MMRQSSKQRGVTLVEVTLTLAISTLLIVTVLAGRNSVRSQAQFSDGMERIKESILSTKSEANTGNNSSGSGNSSKYLTIGRAMRFNTSGVNASNKKTDVLTLLCQSASDFLCQDAKPISWEAMAVRSSTFPWGIVYTGYSTTSQPGGTADINLVFTRDDQTGGYGGAWYPAALSKTATTKSALLANQSPVTLNFKSPDGRTAKIIVDPASGTVEKEVAQ